MNPIEIVLRSYDSPSGYSLEWEVSSEGVQLPQLLPSGVSLCYDYEVFPLNPGDFILMKRCENTPFYGQDENWDGEKETILFRVPEYPEEYQRFARRAEIAGVELFRRIQDSKGRDSSPRDFDGKWLAGYRVNSWTGYYFEVPNNLHEAIMADCD